MTARATGPVQGDLGKVFISYASADDAWARWIAAAFRTLGYAIVTQRDFPIGESFVRLVHEALQTCERTVCVVSEAYLRSRWCSEEWTAALHDGKLFPIRVDDCAPKGLLGSCNYVDLAGCREEDRALALLGEELARCDRLAERTPAYPGGERVRQERRSDEPKHYPGRLPAIFDVPWPRNSLFTGRDELLSRMRSEFKRRRAVGGMHVLAGLAGSGKTSSAVEYAYRYASEYDGVAWLIAADRTTLTSDYMALGASLGMNVQQPLDAAALEARVRDVRNHLARRQMLLIFDNVVSPEDIQAFLPVNCHVIVTTQCSAFPRATIHIVESLDDEDGIAYLAARTGEQQRDALQTVVRLVGGLPLALEQAAAYIESTRMSAREYASLLETHGLVLLEKGQAIDYDRTVGTTWNVALDDLTRHQGGLELLKLCAFFAPDGVQLSDIRAGARQLDVQLPAPLGQVLTDDLALQDLKRALLRYSIWSARGETIAMHGLVQEVTRARMDRSERTLWFDAAVNLLDALFPSEPAFASMKVQRKTTVDVRESSPRKLTGTLVGMSWYPIEDADDKEHAPVDEELAGRLLLHIRFLVSLQDCRGSHLGNYKALLQRAARYAMVRWNQSHQAPPLLHGLGSLILAETPYDRAEMGRIACTAGRVTLALGAIKAAAVGLTLAVQFLEAEPVEDPSSLSRALHALGYLMHRAGRLKESERLLRRALALDESVESSVSLLRRGALSIDEFMLDTLESPLARDLVSLANLCADTRRHREAESLLERASAVNLSLLGPTALGTMMANRALADFKKTRLTRKRRSRR